MPPKFAESLLNFHRNASVVKQKQDIRNGRFNLAESSEGLGVSVTPILGILYVSDSHLLQKSLDASPAEPSEIVIRIIRTRYDDDSLVKKYQIENLSFREFQVKLHWGSVKSPCSNVSNQVATCYFV